MYFYVVVFIYKFSCFHPHFSLLMMSKHEEWLCPFPPLRQQLRTHGSSPLKNIQCKLHTISSLNVQLIFLLLGCTTVFSGGKCNTWVLLETLSADIERYARGKVTSTAAHDFYNIVEFQRARAKLPCKPQFKLSACDTDSYGDPWPLVCWGPLRMLMVLHNIDAGKTSFVFTF